MTNNARVRSRAVAFLSILNLVVPAGLRAADAIVATSTSTATTAPKHHHKHKKKTNSSVAISSAVTAAGVNASQSGAAAAATRVDTGSLNHQEGNNAGGQNMLSGDHTPGTTGTSGQ